MHKDERGIILDLAVGKDWALTFITFTPGAVRGNHVHKKTTQWDFILSGELTGKIGKWTRTMKAFDHIKIRPGRPHAYRAVRNTWMLSFTKGVRVGENYSKDMFKLNDPLI